MSTAVFLARHHPRTVRPLSTWVCACVYGVLDNHWPADESIRFALWWLHPAS